MIVVSVKISSVKVLCKSEIWF